MATCPATSQVNKPVKRQQKPKTEQNQSTKSSNGASSNHRNNRTDYGVEDRDITRTYEVQPGNNEGTATVDETTFISVEQMPQFPGEEIGLIKYLHSHLEYSPEEVGVENVRVIVQVLVDKTGKVTKTKLVRKSLNQRLNDEALRVCGSLPDFTPGRQNGIAVSVWYTIPVTFKGMGSN